MTARLFLTFVLAACGHGNHVIAARAATPTPLPTSSRPEIALKTPGPPIEIEPFSAALTKDRFKKLELKADGSIVADGKKIAMVSGDEVDDVDGKMVFQIMSDGSLQGELLQNGKAVVKDNAIALGARKIAISDDGTIVLVGGKTGAENAGTISGGPTRRTQLLVLVAAAILKR